MPAFTINVMVAPEDAGGTHRSRGQGCFKVGSEIVKPWRSQPDKINSDRHFFIAAVFPELTEFKVQSNQKHIFK